MLVYNKNYIRNNYYNQIINNSYVLLKNKKLLKNNILKKNFYINNYIDEIFNIILNKKNINFKVISYLGFFINNNFILNLMKYKIMFYKNYKIIIFMIYYYINIINITLFSYIYKIIYLINYLCYLKKN
jgi:hypothetical protein